MANNGKGNMSRKPYENYNKLPDLLMNYRSAMIRTLREKFMEQLDIARKEEAEYCKKNNSTPVMAGQVYMEVCDQITRCMTFFEVEALARFVFDDNVIPDRAQVIKRAAKLESVLGWDLKK